MQRVALEYGSTSGWACLRGICGQDEESVESTDSEGAIALLDRLLVDAPGAALGPGHAAELTIPDRDRLLAAVFPSIVGSRVESTLRCLHCEQAFDLDFKLSELLASLAEPNIPDVTREGNGTFRLRDGRRFRLPCGTDERAVASEPAQRAEMALLSRCMIEGSAGDDPSSVIVAMRAVGPTLDLDVAANCPECARAQQVRFDLQHYLLTRLCDERRVRALEVHRIARTYHWSAREILELSRARRRMHFELIERESPVH